MKAPPPPAKRGCEWKEPKESHIVQKFNTKILIQVFTITKLNTPIYFPRSRLYITDFVKHFLDSTAQVCHLLYIQRPVSPFAYNGKY